MVAHQASPSLGFSRQEHWSGLPFPSPMHESEKWKWNCSIVSDSSNPMDCSPPGSSIHGIFQARVLEWGAIAFSEGYWNGLLFPSPGDLPNPCLLLLLHCQADSLPLSHQESPWKATYAWILKYSTQDGYFIELVWKAYYTFPSSYHLMSIYWVPNLGKHK